MSASAIRTEGRAPVRAHVPWERRALELEAYFDRTALRAWERLTSEAPLGRIRASVRAGRDRMRDTLLGWLPADMHGLRVLDAGCGTGALAVAMARRGATVVGVDLSPRLLDLARARLPADVAGRVTLLPGDMLREGGGGFHHVVAMDSLIHYPAPAMLEAVAALAGRAERSVLFTFAPRTAPLAAMHAVGRLFPRGQRAPAIEPVAEARLLRMLGGVAGWRPGRGERVGGGFYTSQAVEMVRA